jgi:hypothetical protein
VKLDDFLNARSIGNLQSVQFVWAPASRRSSSKSELIRILRRQMLDRERVRELYESLNYTEQELLHALLRCEGYRASAQFLLRRLGASKYDESRGREALEVLDHRGLLQRTQTKGPSGLSVEHVQAPVELGDILAEALNLDIREPAVMLSLRRFLQEHGEDEDLSTLIEPEAIRQRLEALPETLHRPVRTALRQPAGILPVECFPDEGLNRERVDPGGWRRALEKARLGTVGYLELHFLGLEDQDDCLILYQEVVQSLAAAEISKDLQLDEETACGVDFITDISTLADYVRANPCRLTNAGRLFKGTRNELLPRAACRTTFFMNEEALLSFKLNIARRLGLLEKRHDGRLHARRSASEWQDRPLIEQVQDIRRVLLDVGQTAAPRHFRTLFETACELLSHLPTDAWMPTDSFLSIVVSRHLMDLVQRGREALDPYPKDDDEAQARIFGSSAGTVPEMGSAVREPMLHALSVLGILDLGRAGDRAVLRPSPLAAFLLGDAEPPPPPANSLLLVNPDGEVILFPEGHYVEVLHQLCGFCDREKSEVTVHLRITKESVQRAALRGMDPEDILGLLRHHSRVPLAQNIEYSVRQWAANVHAAQIETLHVLELPSEEVLDAVLQLPEVEPLVVRRLSPTAVALSRAMLDPEAQDALAKLGIHMV